MNEKINYKISLNEIILLFNYFNDIITLKLFYYLVIFNFFFIKEINENCIIFMDIFVL